MFAIYKRELKSYFDSMIGYVFIAVIVVFIGIYFMAYNLFNGYPNFSYALISVLSILMFTIPILTMKSIAEDRKAKTDQMLMTAPVSLTSIVMGKYLAMLTVLAIPLALSCFCPLIIAANGEAHLKSDYISILALFLSGCVFIAIGMFISSLTDSQVIAAVGTLAALLIIFMWDDLMSFLPGQIGTVLSAFSFRDVFYNFAQYNVLDLAGIVLYLSMSFVFVFLTIQSLQKRRWN